MHHTMYQDSPRQTHDHILNLMFMLANLGIVENYLIRGPSLHGVVIRGVRYGTNWDY